MVPKKKNKVSLIVQAGKLKSMFPDSKVKRNRENKITWEGFIKPSPLSGKYKIKLIYQTGKGIEVFVKEPYPLKLAKNEKSLPHVYSTEQQRLCLYYPTANEWNNGQLYIDTIIPWTAEWLIHYEIWVATGEWCGGGKHPENNQKEENKE